MQEERKKIQNFTSIENQLLISRDVYYMSFDDFDRIEEAVRQSNKLITGLLKYAKGIS